MHENYICSFVTYFWSAVQRLKTLQGFGTLGELQKTVMIRKLIVSILLYFAKIGSVRKVKPVNVAQITFKTTFLVFIHSFRRFKLHSFLYHRIPKKGGFPESSKQFSGQERC